MNAHLGNVTNAVLSVCGMVIFTLLFLTIRSSLEHCPLFQKRSLTVVAVCVSLLCVVGMYRAFFPTGAIPDLAEGAESSGIDALLLPYTALGLALLVMSLLMFLGKFVRGDKAKRHAQDAFTMEPWYLNKGKVERSPSARRTLEKDGGSAHKTRLTNSQQNHSLGKTNAVERINLTPKPCDRKGIR